MPRLVVAGPVPPPALDEPLGDLSPEQQVSEVLGHFNSMINDEF